MDAIWRAGLDLGAEIGTSSGWQEARVSMIPPPPLLPTNKVKRASHASLTLPTQSNSLTSPLIRIPIVLLLLYRFSEVKRCIQTVNSNDTRLHYSMYYQQLSLLAI